MWREKENKYEADYSDDTEPGERKGGEKEKEKDTKREEEIRVSSTSLLR